MVNQSTSIQRTAGLVYCLWLLGILFGITAIVGMYINHTKLASARGTFVYSHFILQIVSFWLVVFGIFLSIILWPGPVAQMIAIACFFIWLFTGLIGSWHLSKSRSLNYFNRPKRTIRGVH